MILIDGYCGSCPIGKIWNGQVCSCPQGTKDVGGFCQANCQEGQLTDPNGICYFCPVNEEPKNNNCECKSGY